jgi:hypothetical protein
MMILYLFFASRRDLPGSLGANGLFLSDWIGEGLFWFELLWEELWGTLPGTGRFIGLVIGLTDEIIPEDKVQPLLFHDTPIWLIRLMRGSFLLLWG